MALIDTNSHNFNCPECGESQVICLDVPVGKVVTGTFNCCECEHEFEVTVSITYTLDVKGYDL